MVSFCHLRIPGAVADSLSSGTHGSKLADLKDKVLSLNEKYKNLNLAPAASTPVTSTTPGTPRSTASPGTEARTLSQPHFSDRDRPVDVNQPLLPAAVLDLAEFQATKEFRGAICSFKKH